MNKAVFLVLLLSVTTLPGLKAQYAPQAPLPGNNAIAQDDVRIVEWASGCTAHLGWVNIADRALGHPTIGTTNDVIGPPGDGVLSLGDSGVAVVTFPHSIKNGEGPDFVVFENAFANPQNDTLAFLEMAFVEVSSDGIAYVRFPAYSQMQDTLQLDNPSYSDTRYYHNLAGKYISGYGTPFDLEELKDTPGLDINNITHIRIVDVVGSINPLYASFDVEGRIINDPYPTPFPSAGFDLNAVGVLQSNKPPTAINNLFAGTDVQIYPNPVRNYLNVTTGSQQEIQYIFTDISGKIVHQGVFLKHLKINMNTYASGLYFLHMREGINRGSFKVVKK